MFYFRTLSSNIKPSIKEKIVILDSHQPIGGISTNRFYWYVVLYIYNEVWESEGEVTEKDRTYMKGFLKDSKG